MLSLKDKVTDKLSSFFSDSPSSQSPAPNQSKARSYSKEGKSLSSVFSSILPSSSFDRWSSDKHSNDFKPIQSPPIKWKSRSLSWRNQMSDSHEEPSQVSVENKTPKPHGEDRDYHPDKGIQYNNNIQKNGHTIGDLGCGRSIKCSKLSKDATGHSMPYLAEESLVISPDLYEFLLSSIPNIVKGCQWVMLYSTLKHGISLRTLIRRSADLPGPCLLIVGDKQGAVFGGMLEGPLNPTPKWKYQGTNQTFVFTTKYGEPRLFRPTGLNRYFYLCLNDLIAFGGGENFALCLDGDLLIGKSGTSETFGNLCLAHNDEFEVKHVELWGFAHSSRLMLS